MFYIFSLYYANNLIGGAVAQWLGRRTQVRWIAVLIPRPDITCAY